MKTEREFLHDISTPISTALFIMESLIESLDQNRAHEGEKLQKKLLEIRDLIERRRSELKSSAT